jgi:hypothetical protein
MALTSSDMDILLQHNFQMRIETHINDDGASRYSIVLPIDGNYFSIERAEEMLQYWQSIYDEVTAEMGLNKRQILR